MRKVWGAMLKAERDGPADDTSKKSRAGTTSENFKFRDVGGNDNHNPPPLTIAGTPYKSCIRKSWAQKNAHLKFKDDDAGISVLALADTIDSATLDPRDAAFWENDGDDEYDGDSDNGDIQEGGLGYISDRRNDAVEDLGGEGGESFQGVEGDVNGGASGL